MSNKSPKKVSAKNSLGIGNFQEIFICNLCKKPLNRFSNRISFNEHCFEVHNVTLISPPPSHKTVNQTTPKTREEDSVPEKRTRSSLGKNKESDSKEKTQPILCADDEAQRSEFETLKNSKTKPNAKNQKIKDNSSPAIITRSPVEKIKESDTNKKTLDDEIQILSAELELETPKNDQSSKINNSQLITEKKQTNRKIGKFKITYYDDSDDDTKSEKALVGTKREHENISQSEEPLKESNEKSKVGPSKPNTGYKRRSEIEIVNDTKSKSPKTTVVSKPKTKSNDKSEKAPPPPNKSSEEIKVVDSPSVSPVNNTLKVKPLFLCPVKSCLQQFEKRPVYINHLEIHEGLKPFVCEICFFGYESETKMMDHYASKHTKDRNYECDVCGKNYLQSYHLKAHQKNCKR